MRKLYDSHGNEYETGHTWPHYDTLEGLVPDHDKINWTGKYPLEFVETLQAIADQRQAEAEAKDQRFQEWIDAGNVPWWEKGK